MEADRTIRAVWKPDYHRASVAVSPSTGISQMCTDTP